MPSLQERLEQARQAEQDGGPPARQSGSNQPAASLQERLERARQGGQRDSNPLAFLNEGIARGAGATVDILDEVAQLAQIDEGLKFLGVPDRFVEGAPPGGSESIERAMNFLGRTVDNQRITPFPGEDAEGFGESVLRGIGDAAGGLVPFGGAARLASGARGAVGSAARTASQGVAKRPATTLAAEAGAGAAAGASGEAAARTFPETEEARALGELVGGAGLPAAGAVLSNVPSVLLLRQARKAVEPLTDSAGPRRAGKRLRALSADQQQAARSQREQTVSDLTPAQRTGERRFAQLEATRRRQDPEFDERIAEQQARASRQLQSEARSIGQGGTISDTRQFLQGRIQGAVDRANERLGQTRPEQREAEASRTVREEIARAEQQARSREAQLFEQVPQDTEVPTEQTRQKFADILDERDVVDDPEDVPSFLTETIGRLDDDGNFQPSNVLGETAPVRRMQRLRSRILKEQRKERAAEAPNRQKLSILGEMQEAILDDIGARAGGESSEAGEALRRALDFSRDVNERFAQGSVGRILGFERRGGPRIPPESTLESTVGRGGQRGLAATDEILRAVEDAPDQTRRQIEDFIRRRFSQQAIRGDEIDVDKARSFLENNADLLDRLPDVQQTLQSAAEGQVTVDELRNSAIGRFLGAREGEELDQILRAQSPGRAAREVVREARQQGSDTSVQGLKSALVDRILDRSKRGDFDDQGQRLISGRALRSQLQDRKLRPVINAVLSDDDKRRLGRVAREFQLIEQAQNARPRPEGLLDDLPNTILTTAARVAGAQAGGQLGAQSAGGSLQTAQTLSGRAKRFVENLTNDKAQELIKRALEPGNEELFRSLITDLSGRPERRRRVNQRLNAFLSGPLSDLVAEDERDDAADEKAQ